MNTNTDTNRKCTFFPQELLPKSFLLRRGVCICPTGQSRKRCVRFLLSCGPSKPQSTKLLCRMVLQKTYFNSNTAQKDLKLTPKFRHWTREIQGCWLCFFSFFFSLHGKQANSGVYISDLFVEPPLHIIFIKLTSSIVIKIKIFPETHTGIIINCRLTGPILTSNSTVSQF